MINTELYNIYANSLIELRKEHEGKVNDLVKDVKTNSKLNTIRFSRSVDKIRESYNSKVFDIILKYKKDFVHNNLNENLFSDKTIDFADYCEIKFNETFDYFESINGLS